MGCQARLPPQILLPATAAVPLSAIIPSPRRGAQRYEYLFSRGEDSPLMLRRVNLFQLKTCAPLSIRHITVYQKHKMRLPYVPNPPNVESEEERAIVERVKQRRGERGLIPLDLALLHSPPVADGWSVSLHWSTCTENIN
jgi:hypothetical protein